MSVKRYDFDCYAFYDSARLNVQECDDGDYILHSDYSELEDRYNALVEGLKFYADEDREDVNWGILESVYDRPATKALEENMNGKE